MARGTLMVQGPPPHQAPDGRITALDLNKGTPVWQIAHGETPDNTKSSCTEGAHHPPHRATGAASVTGRRRSRSPARAGSYDAHRSARRDAARA